MKQTLTSYTSFWAGFGKQAAEGKKKKTPGLINPFTGEPMHKKAADEKPQKVDLKLDLKTDAGKKEKPKPEPKPEPITHSDEAKGEYIGDMMTRMEKQVDPAAERAKKLRSTAFGNGLLKRLYKRRPDLLQKHMGPNPWLAEKYKDIMEANPNVFRIGTGEWDITSQ